MKQYILKDRKAVEEPDTQKWLEWLAKNSRIVKKTRGTVTVAGKYVGDIDVSTVFLGVDHGENRSPQVFETMVFGGPLDQECERCSTWEAAEQMHEKMCEKVRYEMTQI